MRVLVIYAHPLPDSLNGALFACVKGALAEAGHEVDALDFYAEKFDPVLSADERRDYFDVEKNRSRTAAYAARIEAAEGLVFVFPTWCLGPPAILKGFFDRVMVPGVSFRLEGDGSLSPNLTHIKKAAAIVTYGRERPLLWWFGDPPRRMMTRYLKWFLAPGTRPVFLGHYGLHKPDDPRERRFVEKVRRTMLRFQPDSTPSALYGHSAARQINRIWPANCRWILQPRILPQSLNYRHRLKSPH